MSDFALKWFCRGVVAYAFRGIAREDVLSRAEMEAIEPDKEMLEVVSKPLAHMANRSKTLTKNGRMIVDSAEGLEAMIALGMWANTVNRIAHKHDSERTPSEGRKKRKAAKPHEHRADRKAEAEPSRPDVSEEPSGPTAGIRSNLNGFAGVPGVGG